jgi:hypothetical protein
MKLLKITTPLIFVALATGCTSIPKQGTPEYKVYVQEQRLEQAENTIDAAPDWFMKSSCGSEAICASATAKSLDMQLAIDKATLDAKYLLADKIKGLVSAKLSSFVEEYGNTDEPSINAETVKVVQNVITNTSTAGYEISQQAVLPSKQGFRAYVLAQYPLGSANRLLVAETSKNKILNSRARASKAFADLELEIKTVK